MTKSPPAGQSATSSNEPYCPDQCDLIWVNFHPQSGREQDGWRPALVLSPRRYNDIARLCIVCPVTTTDRLNRFQVLIPDGCGVAGWILSDQIKSISWLERGSQFRGTVPDIVIGEVMARIHTLLPS